MAVTLSVGEKSRRPYERSVLVAPPKLKVPGRFRVDRKFILGFLFCEPTPTCGGKPEILLEPSHDVIPTACLADRLDLLNLCASRRQSPIAKIRLRRSVPSVGTASAAHRARTGMRE